MRFVRQQRHDDCGVACVAMLAGVGYGTALAAFHLTPRQNRRTTSRQIINAMNVLDFVPVEPTGLGSWYVRDQLVSLKAWTPTANSIIKMVGASNTIRRFHWCVYNHITGNVWDPQAERPATAWKLTLAMTHYIPFTRRRTR